MQSPSNSQLKAIKHGKGAMLVLAGPGSGKTFVMIQRILNLIHEKQVRPDNILVISFSKASTLELKRRFQREFKNKSSLTTDLLHELKDKDKNNFTEKIEIESEKQVNFATFHACFFHILKETYHYSSRDIITEKQKRDLLRTILLDPAYGDIKKGEMQKSHEQLEQNKIQGIAERQNRFHQNILRKVLNQQSHFSQDKSQKITEEQNSNSQDGLKNITEKVEDYLQKISYYKNKETNELKEKESLQFQQIFHDYNAEMHQQHKLDFDDMGLLCLQLFYTRPDVLEKWQEKFQYILIDEFQDINMVQFRIIQLLVKRYQNLFVVGDDDQSIYSFRGASPRIMLDFEKYYPHAEKVLLETNYRCSEVIVKESMKVIEQNKVRFQKEICSYQEVKKQEEQKNKEDEKYRNIEKKKEDTDKDDNEKVIYQGFENYQKEYSYIGEEIQKLISQQNYKYSDIACIFRTNQDMTGLAEYFARNKIPFVMKESCNSIFRHFIALDILAYLQFFLEGKMRSDFLRIMNKPLRYLSRNALASLTNNKIEWRELKRYYASKKYIIKNIEQLEQNDIWIQKMDLYGACFYIRKVIGYDNYLKEYIKEQNMNWEEVKEILDFVQESTKGMKSLEEWKSYIKHYEEALQDAKEEKEGVHIITMHACKGLEYSIVFLPDCNEGKIPHKKAVSIEEIEEERRMFYVAMTRAKHYLEILHIEDKMKKNLQQSRFLNHIFRID